MYLMQMNRRPILLDPALDPRPWPARWISARGVGFYPPRPSPGKIAPTNWGSVVLSKCLRNNGKARMVAHSTSFDHIREVHENGRTARVPVHLLDINPALLCLLIITPTLFSQLFHHKVHRRYRSISPTCVQHSTSNQEALPSQTVARVCYTQQLVPVHF